MFLELGGRSRPPRVEPSALSSISPVVLASSCFISPMLCLSYSLSYCRLSLECKFCSLSCFPGCDALQIALKDGCLFFFIDHEFLAPGIPSRSFLVLLVVLPATESLALLPRLFVFSKLGLLDISLILCSFLSIFRHCQFPALIPVVPPAPSIRVSPIAQLRTRDLVASSART